MIQNCIIRREMATKKISAENGGFRRERRLKPPKPKNKTQVLSRITFNVSLKIKPDNQMYANVSDPPPPPCININRFDYTLIVLYLQYHMFFYVHFVYILYVFYFQKQLDALHLSNYREAELLIYVF